MFSILINYSVFGGGKPDEGMYPISMLDKLNLRKAGLRITINDIYSPDGHGLIKAVVQLGGCTGSFVSDKGLIVTNHHCVFSSLEPYSKPDNNLLEKGYYAADSSKELPITGLTCRIMESYVDISDEVLKNIDTISDAVKKKAAIQKKINDYKSYEQLKYPDLSIDISEMLPGKSYILFRYRTIKDLRIVFIPPRNVGEYGGETDNWEWPRHGGDFSFVRAYISKDGKATTYNESNIPYLPEEYLNISAGGLKEDDFVCVLGYPGRTYRNLPAEFIDYQQNYLLPYYADYYKWQINTMLQLGENNLTYSIKTAGRIKSYANVMKNYQGKIKALNSLGLYEKKKEEEQNISQILGVSNPVKQKEFLALLPQIDSIYSEIEKTAVKYYWYTQIYNNSGYIKLARTLSNYLNEEVKYHFNIPKTDSIQKAYPGLLRTNYSQISHPFDSLFLVKMFTDAGTSLWSKTIPPIPPDHKGFSGYNSKFTENALASSKLLDSTFIFKTFKKSPGKLRKLDDALLNFVLATEVDYYKTDSMQTALQAMNEALLPHYVDLKMLALSQTFIPDANRTLRFTYGYVKGYTPADATYFKPFTCVNGMLEKDGQADDYVANADILAYLKSITSDGKEVPLNFLYNTDTTGGNSGSPVLNKYGQLIGINFDRSYEATVNDFAWDQSYSRSIGVDIRFVTWYLKNIAKAHRVVDELFIDEEH